VEIFGNSLIESHHHNTRGKSIQPITRRTIDKTMLEAHNCDNTVLVIPSSGMDWDAGRLVDDDQTCF
jgi:hypothetical protein